MILENDNTCALDPCLIIPVAAKSILSIEKYVGDITARSRHSKWLFVDFIPLQEPNELEVWKHPRAAWINIRRQCWVDVDYTGYRSAYAKCYGNLHLNRMVVDHIRNRRFARALGFKYIRLIHINRGVNSSSGRGEEFDVINYKRPRGLADFEPSKHDISYADPADLLKILNMKVGAFPLNNLRDSLHLFYR